VKDVEKAKVSKSTFGFGLGVLRGVTPCFKIVVLAPLMVAVSVYSAIGMVLVFTAVSMVYPLIGFYSANTLHNLVRNRKMLMVVGGLIMVIIGAYYLYESMVSYGVHVPGTGGL
jgi:putative Mn2+ efflux pump MntP